MWNIRSHWQTSLIQQFRMRCIRDLDTINLHTHILGRLQDLDALIWVFGVRVYAFVFLEPCVRLVDSNFRVACEVARREESYCSRRCAVADNEIVDHAVWVIACCCFVCEVFRIGDGGLGEIVNRVVRSFPPFQNVSVYSFLISTEFFLSVL